MKKLNLKWEKKANNVAMPMRLRRKNDSEGRELNNWQHEILWMLPTLTNVQEYITPWGL